MLGITPDYLEKDLKTFGFIFECMCIRDLKIYSQALNGKVSYYHDRYGLESDAVLHIGDGRYALIEFKLGSAEIEEDAQHLLTKRKLVREYNKIEKQVPLREPDLQVQLRYKRWRGKNMSLLWILLTMGFLNSIVGIAFGILLL